MDDQQAQVLGGPGLWALYLAVYSLRYILDYILDGVPWYVSVEELVRIRYRSCTYEVRQNLYDSLSYNLSYMFKKYCLTFCLTVCITLIFIFFRVDPAGDLRIPPGSDQRSSREFRRFLLINRAMSIFISFFCFVLVFKLSRF